MKGIDIFLYKRIFDISVAIIAVIITSPLMVMIAMMIYFQIGRPVIFKQQRIGLYGKPFALYKFRTIPKNIEGKHGKIPIFCRLLRKTALDEVPSFVNVLIGDMSIVGPRPLLGKDYPLLCEMCFERFSILPGLTGLAQISGRNMLPWRRRLMYDFIYYKTLSVAGDVRVLAATIHTILFARFEAASQSVSGLSLARDVQK